MFVRSYAYIRSLGAAGLREVSEVAVLNANYLLARLRREGVLEYLPAAYERLCMHEFVLSGAPMKRELGIKTLDLAKRLLDHGVHPPTVYFPLIVDEALLIEPTETETKETLDRFAEIVAEILREAREDPEIARSAPYTTPVRRLDEAGGGPAPGGPPAALRRRSCRRDGRTGLTGMPRTMADNAEMGADLGANGYVEARWCDDCCGAGCARRAGGATARGRRQRRPLHDRRDHARLVPDPAGGPPRPSPGAADRVAALALAWGVCSLLVIDWRRAPAGRPRLDARRPRRRRGRVCFLRRRRVAGVGLPVLRRVVRRLLLPAAGGVRLPRSAAWSRTRFRCSTTPGRRRCVRRASS